MAIVTLEETKDHLVTDGNLDDAIITSYMASAEAWVLAWLNMTEADLVGLASQKLSILKQAVLLVAGQFYMQREGDVLPGNFRPSNLVERLLATIRTRQISTLTDAEQTEEEPTMLKVLNSIQSVSDTFKFPNGEGTILLRNEVAGEPWRLEFKDPAGDWNEWPSITPAAQQFPTKNPTISGNADEVTVVPISHASPTTEFRLRRGSPGAEAWIY